MNEDNKSEYLKSLKSLDTEEHIDLFFYRRVGYAWACLAKKLHVTPNAITIASIILGIAAGWLFYYNELWINVIGMLLLVWANSFDSADGQLARMTHQYSRLGRVLDGAAGDLWFFAIYLAIILRENTFSPFFSAHTWVIWAIAVAAALCHAKQASMADCYRQFHLYFLKGKEGSELDNADVLRERYRAMKWGDNWFQKLVLFFYSNYTNGQESMTPAMQRLRRELRKQFPGETPIPTSFREDFRQASLPLMKYTNILSFNWRTIALFASLFAAQPWLYFVFELTVLNAILVYMMLRHESMCRRFTKALQEGQYAA